MKADGHEVTVIVPTVASAARRETLERALRSIKEQEAVKVVPLVVANGTRFDADLLAALESRADVRFHYRKEGGLVGALKTGRELVDTPFFAFLDDDDEYLPHALRSRLLPMREDAGVDAVIGNGYRMKDGVRSASAWNIEEARQAPLEALLTNNWLTSCGGLYRTARVGGEYFEDIPAYAEWTYLAYKLCLTRRLAFVNDPAYVIHYTAGSLSTSTEYGRVQVKVLERALQLQASADLQVKLRAKYGAALHNLAGHCLKTGDRWGAWSCHLKSLLQPEGMRYVAYTRKLLGL